MNHYKARQRENDGRWDYTCRTGRGRVYPVGYCAGWREYSADDLAVHGEEHAARLNAEREPFREHYHTDGHETEAEARACYRRYRLDHARFHRWEREELPGTLGLCDADGCTGYSAHFASVGYGAPETFRLCAEHLNRETLEALYPEVGESWSS